MDWLDLLPSSDLDSSFQPVQTLKGRGGDSHVAFLSVMLETSVLQWLLGSGNNTTSEATQISTMKQL